MNIAIPVTFLAVFSLSACTSADFYYDEYGSGTGLTRQQLIFKLGPPLLELDTSVEGGPPTTALVYRNPVSEVECLDTYVIETRTGTVLNHSCL